ncbi:hypothetical protein BH10ACT7_BH10ACT7_16140 [soil metagenome]
MRRLVTSLLTAAALVVVITGCGAPTNPSADPSSSPRPSASSTPTPTAVAEEEWVTYTTPSGLATFELPATWYVEVVNPSKLQLLNDERILTLTFLEQIGGIGSPPCDATYPYETLDDVEIPIVSTNTDPTWNVPSRIAYRAIQFPGMVAAGLGTTDAIAGQGGQTCGFFNIIGTQTLGQFSFATQMSVDQDFPGLTFATMDEARAFMQTPVYATLMRILTSVRA